MSDSPVEISDVSDTARWVAVYRARETERPDAVFRDPFARRLAGERDLKLAQTALLREAPTPPVTAEELSQLFQPFSDWRLLALEDKRRILAAVVPEIHVADYTVKAICMILPHGGKVVRPVGFNQAAEFSRIESRRTTVYNVAETRLR